MCVCVFKCVQVPLCMQMCIHVCVGVHESRENYLLFFLRQGLSLGPGLTKWLVSLASEPERTCFHLPSTRLTSGHLPILSMPAYLPQVMGLELMFARQTF